MVGDRVSTMTRKAEMRIRLGRKTNSNVRTLWEIEHFDFPVVDFVQLGKRKIRLHGGGGGWIGEKGEFCPGVNKERGNQLVVGIKTPRRDAFLLDREKLR
jgi:hypothetical protein